MVNGPRFHWDLWIIPAEVVNDRDDNLQYMLSINVAPLARFNRVMLFWGRSCVQARCQDFGKYASPLIVNARYYILTTEQNFIIAYANF